MSIRSRGPIKERERVLLFIPAFNCERQISRVIDQLDAETADLIEEVIIVDNRSGDATRERAIAAIQKKRGLHARLLLNRGNYGLGGSHKVAFNYARAHGFDYCIVLHGDDQATLADLVPLLRSGVHRDQDCLLGARFMPGASLHGYSAVRTLGNRIFNTIYSVAARRALYDLGSGLNIYRVSALDGEMYLPLADDLTFNYQFLLESIAARWRIHFFPIIWREEDQVSNVKLFRQSLKVLKIVLNYARWGRAYDPNRLQAKKLYSHDTIFESALPQTPVLAR